MCAIGRALMSRPKLLLMDEPSAGLAPLVVAQVFELVQRIRAEGLTVLIVEQNVQQVLDVVDRAYLLEVGAIKLAGTSAELKEQRLHSQVVYGAVAAMDIYLLEAIINGLLLGGVLALLALGLNLIFGVIDVVWIAYADIVMCGMYVIYFLYAEYGVPLPLACLIAIAGMAALRRRRSSAHHCAGPQLGAAQSAAWRPAACCSSCRASRRCCSAPSSAISACVCRSSRSATIYVSFARLIAFGVGLVGAVALYFFLKRTYIGTAIRAIAQDRDIVGLMGVDQRRIYLVTSAIGGALAGLAACLLALQYDVHPFIGNTFGPVIFMICVLGGLGNMIGGFIASFIISQIIAIGGYYSNTELSYVLAFTFFIVLMFVRPRGLFAR